MITASLAGSEGKLSVFALIASATASRATINALVVEWAEVIAASNKLSSAGSLGRLSVLSFIASTTASTITIRSFKSAISVIASCTLASNAVFACVVT